MDNKFKKGDKVRYIDDSDSALFNQVGTVLFADASTVPYFVEFTALNDCFWCCEENLELVSCENNDDFKDCTEVAVSTIRDPENGAIDECQVPYEFTVEPTTPAPPNYYDKHYDGAIQPIELMQLILTPEEFKGFLKGNIIKYTMRCGKKDDPEKEFTKIRRYKQWLDLAEEGITIDPRV